MILYTHNRNRKEIEIMQEDIRKLVTIKTIDDIMPIENADKIEVAVVGGWRVVVKKGEFQVGDNAVYFEIDSFLPADKGHFDFLVERSSKTVKGPDGQEHKGHVLRTIRLRGVISQGLLMPVSQFFENVPTQEELNDFMEELGVFKYEKTIYTIFHNGRKELPSNSGIIDYFPQHIRKTDSERIQNLSRFVREVLAETDKSKWVATEKVDGMSTTWWKDEENKLHVASRNYEVELDGKYLEMAKKYDIENLLSANEWLQAEMAGEGIQSNPLKIDGNRLFVFNYNLNSNDKEEEIKRIMVPVYDLEMPDTVDGFIEQVNGIKSLVNPQVQAEGIVWTNVDGEKYYDLSDRHQFKAINNTYLLKH